MYRVDLAHDSTGKTEINNLRNRNILDKQSIEKKQNNSDLLIQKILAA